MALVILNGGSSSWKCGVYDVAADAPAATAAAALAEVRLGWASEGSDEATLEIDAADGGSETRTASVPRAGAVARILDELAKAGVALEGLTGAGHRIVHGASAFRRTTWLDPQALAKLAELEPFAPSHNPIELAAVATVRERLPGLRQYAVFDTQFHRDLAPEAYVYPGPYAWLDRGIRRYGFHGSSVAYASERAAAILGRPLAELRLLVAHLGGGCSVTAVRNGVSVDTSMGFTPLDGTMMATRSGAIDPGIAFFLLKDDAASPAGLERTLNHESGLAGVSGVSGDVREVDRAAAGGDERATLALGLFAHRAAATIAGLRASLDGLDALVFTGGIGEHAAGVRADIVRRLDFCGLALDAGRNAGGLTNADLSTGGAAARTLVVTAREEWYVAREGARLLGSATSGA